MQIITFTPDVDVNDILTQVLLSENDGIILYHVDRSDEISSLEMPEVCKFFHDFYSAMVLHTHGMRAYTKLDEQTTAEMFICELAWRIYQDIGDSKVTHRYASTIQVGETGETVLDVINRVKNS